MAEKYVNNAWTTLASDCELGTTTITVANQAPFDMALPLDDGDFFRVSVWNEVMKVIEMDNGVWQVARNFEGSNDETIPKGSAVIHQVTAGMMQDVVTGPQGPAGVGVPPGGTTGQILAKASNADYDTVWIDNTGGDTMVFVGAKVGRSTNQTIPNATATNIVFDVTEFDTSGFFDSGTHDDRLTVPVGKAGYYQIGYNINIAGNAGFFAASIKKNGTDYPVGYAQNFAGPDVAAFSVIMVLFLDEGDYLEMEIFQVKTGGGTWDVVQNSGSPVLYCAFIGTA